MALDERGRISTWNRQLERVTGYSRAEMLGAEGAALVGSDERPHDLPLKGGGARKVRWSRAEIPDADGAPLVYAVGIDVTNEQEMLLRTMRAERLAAVGTLAAGLAHEVRNPLNSASLQLAVLERRLERGETGDKATSITRIIKGEIDRLERLVREFLAFAKPTPLDPRPVDLPQLLAGTVDLIAPEAEAARIAVKVDADARASPGSRRRRAPPSGLAQPDPQRGRGHAGAGRHADPACPRPRRPRRDRRRG